MVFDAWSKLVRGLTKTREGLLGTLRSTFGAASVDETALEDLETGLLAADLGPGATPRVPASCSSWA